ncbi:MAG: thioredoxin-disulfide reductase [Elusimicrobiota bacterium]|jgi:thioredoxin reductase (NADPH)|nr:thioredoxin-disulfide reductase [Elusimicrobiota bacterium]
MINTDILAIGSGPAGCTAAIYGVRSGYKTIVLCGASHGGQLVKTNDMENFPGFVDPISGYEVMDRIHKQCSRLGVEFMQETAVKIETGARPFTLHCASGLQIAARAVIISVGACASRLGIESEKRFMGKGVSTCATCDGFFYKNKTACVIGGGNRAVEEAVFLTKFCKKVYLIHRRETFRAHKVSVDKARAIANLEFVLSSAVESINGDESGVKSITVRNINTKVLRDIETDGVFVAVGTRPQTDFLKDSGVELTSGGYIVVNEKTHTNIKGIFAAGDCTNSMYNQAVIAAGSGAKAAMEAVSFLNEDC